MSTCEVEGLSHDTQMAYVIELSNGTKFLVFLRSFGYAHIEEILSELGETANIEADQQQNLKVTKLLLHKLK